MRVGVEPSATCKATAPKKLFDGPIFAPGGNPMRTYDISPDGQRFLMIKQAGSDQNSVPTSLVVVQNFGEELKARVPPK